MIVLELMRFPDEVRPAAKLDLPASDDPQYQPSEKELDLARRLVDDMTEEWNPGEHHDEYQSALMAYIEEKIAHGDTAAVKGGEREREPGVTANNTIDLAAYLEQSILAAKGSKGPDVKKPAARKSAGKVAKKTARKAVKKTA